MSDPLTFERLAVGDHWISPARTVTEADVVQFAGMTGDFNPLHVDHEFARRGPFRRPIAHGLLGMAWVAGLGSHSPSVSTEAFVGVENWEFRLPMFIGDTVHVRTTVTELSRTGRRRGRVVWRRDLVNQQGEIVQTGRFVTLVATELARNSREEGASREEASANGEPSGGPSRASIRVDSAGATPAPHARPATAREPE